MAHTHHCKVCNEVMGVCDDVHCQGDDNSFCSRHHPDPAHRVEDKPTVRMTVNIAKDETPPKDKPKGKGKTTKAEE